MENTPKNVRYLRIIGSVLTIIALVLFFLAYKALSGINENDSSYFFPLIGLFLLSILAFINAYSTFKFSSNIRIESFDKWQLMQKRFWLVTAFIVAPFIFIVLFILFISVAPILINDFN